MAATMAEVAEGRDAGWRREAVTSPATTRTAQMGKVLGYIKGLHATHLIDVGTRLGLFERLSAGPEGLSAEALAAEAGLHTAYVRQWCETACALELLDYDPARGFRLAPYLDEMLGRPESAYYVGRWPAVHLLVARDYARYPELFRDGGEHPYGEHDQAFLRGVAEATCALPRMFLDAVLPKLPDLERSLQAGAAILDLGCGGGYAIVELAERYPRARCVGIDCEPTSIGLARELIRGRGVGDRVEARLLDAAALPAELEGAFDLVTSFLVLHEIHPDKKRAALAQCMRALRPGGRLLLFDERYPGSAAELRDPSLSFAAVAQWYELTWGNVINTRAEIHALLAEQHARVTDETTLSRFYVVTAIKDEDGVASPGI